ncbi:hypothetical protein SK128_004488 [Halocaridina rubra]|uniref:Uncharacterized protein n=1 Tax=Halocaridina rubra TaxID=373956 RepID=A0AAN8ZVY4_HALRR
MNRRRQEEELERVRERSKPKEANSTARWVHIVASRSSSRSVFHVITESRFHTPSATNARYGYELYGRNSLLTLAIRPGLFSTISMD